MSHYAVAVFANDPMDFDNLLTPYSENNEDEFIFEPVPEEELRRRYENFKKNNPEWSYKMYINDNYKLKDGQWGYYYNPHGYYDYYSLGGRDYLYDYKNKNEEYEEFPLKSKLDFFPARTEKETEKIIKKAKSYWKTFSKFGDGYMSAEYYNSRYGSEDVFVREALHYDTPYAFVTPDGVWHAPGKVGWFALSDESADSMQEYYEEWVDFINNAPDCYVALTDCHI